MKTISEDYQSVIDARAAMLLSLLELEKIEENLYLGQNEQRLNKRLFGGQVLSQAVVAATNTVDELLAWSEAAF